MRILPLSKELLDDFIALFTEFYTELRRRQGLKASPDEYKEDAIKYAERDLIFLAYEEGPLGFIRISSREERYWIEEIYVRPEARRRGVGRALVSRAEKEVSKKGSHLYLYVLPQDLEAISFWKKMGYEIVNSIELVKPLKGNGETWPTLVDLVPFKIWRWEGPNYEELLIRFSLEKFLSEASEELLRFLFPSSLLNYLRAKEEISTRRQYYRILAEKAEGRVLDVGCGLGRLCYLLTKNPRVKEVVGIEEREEIVEITRNVFKTLSIEGVKIVQGNFLEAPLEGKFDSIIFFFVLHDFEPEKFLERALELLAKGGKILIAEPDLNNLRNKIETWAINRGLKVEIEEGNVIKTHGRKATFFSAVLSQDT